MTKLNKDVLKYAREVMKKSRQDSQDLGDRVIELKADQNGSDINLLISNNVSLIHGTNIAMTDALYNGEPEDDNEIVTYANVRRVIR